MIVLQRLVLLALAGAFGTMVRFLLLEFIKTKAGTALGFPLGTLIVNMTGCFLAGLFLEFAEMRLHVASEVRVIVMVGFMGAFTTFSSVIVETAHLIRKADWLAVHLNLVVENFAGLVSLFGGSVVAKSILM
jgi:CrcB protein